MQGGRHSLHPRVSPSRHPDSGQRHPGAVSAVSRPHGAEAGHHRRGWATPVTERQHRHWLEGLLS